LPNKGKYAILLQRGEKVEQRYEMKVIARLRGGYSDKFGIPRQSMLVENGRAQIVFEPPYREKAAIKGITGFSHLWLLWCFSENKGEAHRLTVRPPRLGGNRRMGVFATRSPYRPNPIGLSCVKLVAVEDTADGPVLVIEGADLLDGTPIFDIKPYLPFTDCRPEAVGGFAEEQFGDRLSVTLPDTPMFSKEERETLCALLRGDPRPAYQQDERTYHMDYLSYTVAFSVKETHLTVHAVTKGEVKHE